MTTIVAAHSALSTAVGASDSIVAAPGVIVFSEGSDLASLGGSQVEWQFRVTPYVGIVSDEQDTTVALAALVLAKLAILRALAGWRIIRVGPDYSTELAGGKHLAANIIVSTPVDLT